MRSWMDEYVASLDKRSKSLFLSSDEAKEARASGFITARKRYNWEVGDTVDIYAGEASWGMTGTIAEADGNECLIEIW